MFKIVTLFHVTTKTHYINDHLQALGFQGEVTIEKKEIQRKCAYGL